MKQHRPHDDDKHGQPHGTTDGNGHNHGHPYHRFDSANLAHLDNDERRQRLPPKEVLTAAAVGAGHVFGDIGCGPGFFTLPASHLVGPRGRVYAVDVQPEMVAAVGEKIKAAGAANVTMLHSAENHIPLADATLDRALLAFMLHETMDQQRFLREVRRLLRASAELAVVEWRKVATVPGPPLEHRLSEEEVEQVARVAGYHPLTRQRLGDEFYLSRFVAA